MQTLTNEEFYQELQARSRPVNGEYRICLEDLQLFAFDPRLTEAQKAGKLGGVFGGLSGVIGGLGISLAAFAGIKTVAGLAVDAEQTQIAFDTMLGSVEAGKKAIGDLKDFAAVTPFEQDEVIQSGRSMLAFGFGLNELKGELTAVGNVASGLKIPFGELSEIYGKGKVQGTYFSEDLNQLAGRGIPIFTELSKVMGVPAGQIKKLASEGKVGFAEVQKAFHNMSGEGGQFFNLMDKQSATVGGKWSTLKDGASALGLEIGNGLLPAMSWGIDKLTAFTEVVKSGIGFLKENREVVEAVGVAVGIGAVGFGAYTLATSAGAIATSIFTGAQWLLNAALTANPIGLIIAGIAAFSGAIYYAWNHSEKFRGSILGLWEAGKTVFANIAKAAVQYFGGLGDLLKGVFTFDADLIKSGFTKTLDSLKSATVGLGDGVADSFNKGFGEGVNQIGKLNAPGADGKVSIHAANPSWDKTGASGAGSAASSVKAGIAGVQGDAKAAKNQVFNIEKVVENLSINTTNLRESTVAIENAVRESLVKALRDVEILGSDG